jgi:hypothetical protein
VFGGPPGRQGVAVEDLEGISEGEEDTVGGQPLGWDAPGGGHSISFTLRDLVIAGGAFAAGAVGAGLMLLLAGGKKARCRGVAARRMTALCASRQLVARCFCPKGPTRVCGGLRAGATHSG